MAIPIGLRTAQESRFLPEGRRTGPMPWVIAVMMFLTVLAAAAALAMFRSASNIGSQLADRATVQIAEGNPERRADLVRQVRRALDNQPFVERVRPVDEVELRRMMQQWIGQDGLDADLPIPALIDVDLVPQARQRDALRRLETAVRGVTPQARVEPHAGWLGPVARLIRYLGFIAAGIVTLMLLSMAAILSLSARAFANTHAQTLDLLHLVGATDAQIVRLFQRRLALDAAFGGAIGFVGGAVVLLGAALLLRDVEGPLFAVGLGWQALLLFLLPLIGVLLALVAARFTIRRQLEKRP